MRWACVCYAKCWCLKVLMWLQGGEWYESPRKSHLIPKCILWCERMSECERRREPLRAPPPAAAGRQATPSLKERWMNVRRPLLEQQTKLSLLTSACVCVSTMSRHFFYLSVFILIVVHTDCLVVNRPADKAMLLLLLLLATLHTSSVEQNESSGTTAAWLPL